MGKSRKNSIMKNIDKTASQTLPVVDKGLKTVGRTAKDVAQASIPIVEKGVSAVYGTMASGLNLVENVGKKLKMSRRHRTRNISRGRKGGRRSRRRYSRRN